MFLSHLDTIHHDSIIDVDQLTGGKRQEKRASIVTQYTLGGPSRSGQLIDQKKQVTVPSRSPPGTESDDRQDSVNS